MSSLSNLLPAPPTGFQRFAWNNLALLLPESWNLHSHRGTETRGTLLFADLLQIRLELRWKSAPRLWPLRPNPARLLERTLAKLRKRGQDSFSTHDLYTAIHHPSSTTILLTHENQLLELHWPAADSPPHATGATGLRSSQPRAPSQVTITPEHFNLIAPDFAQSLQLLAHQPARLWSVYGATGDIPRSMTAKNLSMLPGTTRLEFRPRSPFPTPRRITLASFSRADHLLAHQTLPQWAAANLPFLKPHKDLPWQLPPHSADHAQLTLQTRQGLLRRPITHTLTLHHDAPHNRIQLTHTIEPLKR